MNMTRLLLIFATATLGVSALAAPPAKKAGSAAASKDVTAAQVNGTWEYRANTFRIWALGGGRLQVAFDGLHEYQSPVGPMANTGEAAGFATIVGDTATFRPEGGEPDFKIVLIFRGGVLLVTQEGFGTFGAGVRADGTYRRTSATKPKF
jgi:hypothetical protein